MQPKRTKQKFRLKRLSWKLLASKSITTLLHSTLPSITVYLTHIKPQSYVFFPGWRHWWTTRPLCRKQSRRQPTVFFCKNHDLFWTGPFLEAPWKPPGLSARLNVFWYSSDARIEARLGDPNPGIDRRGFETLEFFRGVKNEASTPSRLNLKELAREGTDSPRGQFLDLFFGSYIFTNSWYGKEN